MSFIPSVQNAVAVTALLVLMAGGNAGAEAQADRVRDTRFNYKRGFYSSSITVLIHSETPGARIRFTLDGTTPTPTRGKGNANPVTTTVDKTTTLRAIAYKKGMLPSNVDTQTYVFLKDVIGQSARIPGYPTPMLMSGMEEQLPLDYEMDPEILGDPRYRFKVLKGLKAVPTLSIVLDKEDLFGKVPSPEGQGIDLAKSGVYWAESGEGSTKPASVELLYPFQPAKNTQSDTAIRGHSWRIVKRAFRLEFQKEYGPGKWESSLFRDAPLNGETASRSYDRIVLRSGKNRSWVTEWSPDSTSYTRDQWARDTQIAMSGLGSHGAFVHLYLNGIYWGLYNACERPDAWFLANHLGGNKEDWFSVRFYGRTQGDSTRWDYLVGELKDRDMRDPSNYEELQGYLDTKQFADYLILCWYMRVVDWPTNNWYAGHRVDPTSPVMFFVWDAEMSWDSEPPPSAWVHPRFRASENSKPRNMVGIWHSLRKSREFMTLFADRVYKHCFNGGALSENEAIARWRTLNEHIADAVIAESVRWGDARKSLGEPTRTRDNTFLPEVERVAERMRGNVPHFLNMLRLEGYYPPIDPPRLASETSMTGPRTVEMSNPNEDRGTIYYTLNGEDPRAAGGAVSRNAHDAGDRQKVSLGSASMLKARVKAGNEWSALSEVSN